MRAMRRASLFAAALVAACSFLPASARADETTAEALFKEGIEALKTKDWEHACKAFSGSEKAEPAAGTELNLGFCNENLERYATAWGWYKRAVGTALHHVPQPQTERAEKAQKEADRLYPKLHFGNVTLKGGPYEGLTITRDGGEAVPAEALGSATALPLDSGKHVFDVVAKGKKPYKREVTVGKGPGTDGIELGPLEDAPVEKPVAGGPGTTIVVADPGAKQRTLGFIVGGGGIIAGLTGGVLQLLAIVVNNKASDYQSQLNANPQCSQPNSDKEATTNAGGLTCGQLHQGHDDRKSAAKGDQTAAIIVGGTGIVLIGVGVALVLTAPSRDGATQGKPRVFPVPLVGSGQAGLGLGGTF